MSPAISPIDAEQPPKVAFVADYPPRKCGIATFTHDLRQAVAAQHPDAGCGVLAVNDVPEGYDYAPEVRFKVQEQRLRDYREAADFLRFNGFDVLCLQHEFGIYGGRAGSHILALLEEVRLPVVTTLHTVLMEPSPDQRRVMDELVRQSERLVVMTERGRSILQEIYHAPPEKIDLIAHGIPDTPFVDPSRCKEQFGVEGKRVLLTFGLLSPSKGIEYVIRALPEITRQHPELIYIVLGVTHPNLLRTEGELYRLELERLTAKLGMQQHVAFYNRFVELDELKQLIGAADIYITPYLNKAQITSGTLCYAFGCGKAVISTPYWHAEELLADGRGVLVPFRDSGSIASAVNGLLQDEARLGAMCERAYLLGRETTWEPHRPPLLHLISPGTCRSPASPRASVRRQDPGPTAVGTPRAHAGPRGAAHGFGRHLPACGLCDAQLLRGVLHRRQRASSPPDGPARAIAPRLAGSAAACDHLFGLCPARFRQPQSPFSELHELRSSLAGRARFRRLLRAVPLGIGRLLGAVKAPQLSEMGGRAVPAGSAGCGADDLTTNLGLCPARRSGVPRELERGSQRRRHER